MGFGGFHDNTRDCKYSNDLHAFDLETRQWKKLETVGAGPSPRSACQMFPLADGRVVVYGGYFKQKVKKDVEKGVTHSDMFLLSPDKHDETMTKWRWQFVKQVGVKPSVRTGFATAVGRDCAYMFGGVQDREKESEESDSEDDMNGDFYDELYTLVVEGEKATWHRPELTGKKDPGEKKRRRKVKEGEIDDMEDGENDEEDENVEKIEKLVLEEKAGPSTVTVESGAFTISSTIGEEEMSAKNGKAMELNKDKDIFVPSARFGAGMVMKGSILYMFGGIWEDGEKDYTLKDFHSLDTHKMDTWNTIIESDVQTMEWYGSSDEDDDEDEDDDGDMDVN